MLGSCVWTADIKLYLTSLRGKQYLKAQSHNMTNGSLKPKTPIQVIANTISISPVSGVVLLCKKEKN